MSQTNSVQRNLKTRHVTMIALGGCIGTGLFMTSGSTISKAGPGGGLVAYIAMGLMVYFLMTSLGELATNLPVSGSFATYNARYVDPALGFAMGWNYWFNWAITVAVDISTAALLIQYWLPKSPGWIWSLLVLIVIFLINALTVSTFGETEYWLSIIKVTTVIIFLIIGFAMIFGIMNGPAVGLKNFTYKKAPFVGGIPAIINVFLIAGFSFQGTELIGVTAGESKDPKKAVPKAINDVFWRILLFYILSIFIIAALIPYTSPNLLSAANGNIAVSPFTLVFKRAGLAFAASFMNAVVLTSVLSSANSGAYASTRMLYSLAQDKYAPKIFAKTTKNGIPFYALLATILVSLLTFTTSIFGQKIYMWLVAASGLTGFIAWVGIALSHYRFRQAFIKQGHQLSELKYHAKLFPLGPIIALILCIIVIGGQNIEAFVKWDWQQIGITYISVPLVLILYFGYKWKHHTKIIPLDEIDVSSKI
ncbi:amino acid permease [Lactobacillus sp. W8089]|nr:amino acid permease [Lactobacillus sp. W8086]MBI0108583.1 amino acid permease [Lactobacillus sp. W8085]MBI0111801.1 amino acid permease [Lactobacillus sp. W8088]MBI0115516.1 amino acid permease [Lactobacillus sp. W8087]MBI0119241.1 amino acid permease [Lactobacillus sp. W8089]MBI0131206.1 amino acid permease [Lactobacillus sp. W8090]